MHHAPTHAAIAVAAAALVLLTALTGCAPLKPHISAKIKTPTTSSHPVPAPHATPIPVSTPTATPLPANALFRITATATQPGGATVDLVQTVFAPSAPTTADTTLLNAQCNTEGSPDWQTLYSGAVDYVTSTMTATPRSGTPAWNTNADVAAYFAFGSSAYSGQYQVAQANCAPGYIGVPGTIHAVTPVLASNPALDTHGWGSSNANYGFDGDGNDPSDPDGAGDTIVSNCSVELSAAATTAVPAITAWSSQPFVQTSGCNYQVP